MKQTRWLSEFSSLSEYTRHYPNYMLCALKRNLSETVLLSTRHIVIKLVDEKTITIYAQNFVYGAIEYFDNQGFLFCNFEKGP